MIKMPTMKPAVYFSDKITQEAVAGLLDASGIKNVVRPHDLTAIKLHFGEKGNRGYVRPDLLKPVVEKIKSSGALPFVTDANTIYVGERANAIQHLAVAHQHGFTYENLGCPVIIADGLRGNAEVCVPVNLRHFKSVKIANSIFYSDSIVFVSHFKGHELTGFGGAIKNVGMGCATRAGKYEMHNSVLPKLKIELCNSCGVCVKWCPGKALTLPSKNSVIQFDPTKCIGCGECILSCKQKVFTIPWDDPAKKCQEKIVEYTAGVLQGKLKTKSVLFLNVLNFITKYCDCYETKETPLIDDIGMVASEDPVAVDQASVDIINKKCGYDFFRKHWPEIDWEIQMNYGQEVGLGSRDYALRNL